MEQRVSIERMEEAINLFGSFDENIRLLEAEFHVTVVNRDGELRISGSPARGSPLPSSTSATSSACAAAASPSASES